MNTRTYTATVTQEGQWLTVRVEGIGQTRVRAMDDAMPAARTLIAVERARSGVAGVFLVELTPA